MFTAQNKPRDSIGTVATVTSYSAEMMPWEDEDWVPRTKSGKQRTPNMIRNELQRYINECKANRSRTQTDIIQEMSVNNNSFRRFMDPSTYKGQWSAVQNGTYWAAAKLLEKVKYEKEQAKKAQKKAGGKRKAVDSTSIDLSSSGSKKIKAQGTLQGFFGTARASSPSATTTVVAPKTKSKAEIKAEVEDLIQRVLAVEGVTHDVVNDSCPELVKKINEFLARDGVNKAMLLSAFGNINSNSLNRFLSGKKQDQCGNVTYKESYVFFEKLRILEGKQKTNARFKNEREHPRGFPLQKSRECVFVSLS